MICPGRWRALSTAVVLLCPLLDLVSPLDWLVDFCLPCVPFVPLDFALFQPPAILALWTYRLVPCNELTALQGTCMSDLASTEAISALTEAIRDLTVALNPPAADSDSVSVGDWELLGEESEDFRVKLDTTCLEVKYRTIEEGPGPTPAYCEDLALRRLTGKPPGPSARCRRAFVAGFFKSHIHLRILFQDSRLLTGLFSSALLLATLCTSHLAWTLDELLRKGWIRRCLSLSHPLLRWRFSVSVQGFVSPRQEYGEVSNQVPPGRRRKPPRLELSSRIEKSRQSACVHGHPTTGSKWWPFVSSSRAIFG